MHCPRSSLWAAVHVKRASPNLVDPNLGVRTVIENLDQPTSMAFLGTDDFLVLEKATGKVQHVVGRDRRRHSTRPGR